MKDAPRSGQIAKRSFAICNSTPPAAGQVCDRCSLECCRMTRVASGRGAPRDPSLDRAPRIGLQSKLVASYLSVGLALTLLNLVAAHVLERHASRIDASRTETARMSKEISLTASSAFEEGFSFVLSGDDAEK